jgi:hypothetical protein
MTAGLLPSLTAVGLAVGALGCTRVPLAVQPASPAVAAMRVYVEPDAMIGKVLQERGREVIPRFREALDAALVAAGYHVLDTADTPHDLTIRMSIARVGFAYRPWAEGVLLEVTGGGRVLAQASRPTLNWMSAEGRTTPERLVFAAHTFVNQIDEDPALAQFAASAPPLQPVHAAAPVAPTPPPAAAAPLAAPAPAASPTPAP